MRRLPSQLGALRAALRTVVPRQAAPATTGDIEVLIRSIDRKAHFVRMHTAVLVGIEWDLVESVGSDGNRELRVKLSDATLIFEHSKAVIDHVYLAFDGLTAALVNAADTFGRLVNLAYGLQIPERQASLLAVRDQCAASPLGTVLRNPTHMDWFARVRDLRGRCQHADVEAVLSASSKAYSKRGEPSIDQAYSWCVPTQERPVLSYAQEATTAAEDCLLAAVAAIVAGPAIAIY
jgi:hypothetical protein